MIALKLLRHFPNAEWAMSGDTYDTLEWFGPGEKPTEAAIAALPLSPFPSEVQAEANRRLALGFDYDFGDTRGVHRIGTTPQDMLGWDEVTKGAQAAINAGLGNTVFSIATDTGLADVTANEWQGVLLAAAQVRQPIFSASFALQRMDPIPLNYADDEYWP